MNDTSKLMLSDEEQQLVNNSSWILTKRVVMNKVQQLLGDVAVAQKTILQKEKKIFPAEIFLADAKISKGENYLGLPFMILDYPRCFNAENIFAVRTMFWWGNFFSVTLQLSGKYEHQYREKLLAGFDTLKHNRFYLCINEIQWHHHFEQDNYIAADKITAAAAKEIILKNQFIKLAVQFPLQQWNDIPALLEKSFVEIVEMLKT